MKRLNGGFAGKNYRWRIFFCTMRFSSNLSSRWCRVGWQLLLCWCVMMLQQMTPTTVVIAAAVPRGFNGPKHVLAQQKLREEMDPESPNPAANLWNQEKAASGATCRLIVDIGTSKSRVVLFTSNAYPNTAFEVYDSFDVGHFDGERLFQPKGWSKPDHAADLYDAFDLRRNLDQASRFLTDNESILLQPKDCLTMFFFTSDRVRLWPREQQQKLEEELFVTLNQHAELKDEPKDPSPVAAATSGGGSKKFRFRCLRESIRTLSVDEFGYFLEMAANYLDSRIEFSLSPGNMELYGMMSLEKDEFLVAFDKDQRWRRSFRRKQVAKPLNVSDFFIHSFRNYGTSQMFQRLSWQLYNASLNQVAETIDHPCVPSGYTFDLDGTQKAFQQVEQSESKHRLVGKADAKKCIQLLTRLLMDDNANCPFGDHCVLQSVVMPRSTPAFYAVGEMYSAVFFGQQVLNAISNKASGSAKQEENTTALADSNNMLPWLNAKQLEQMTTTACEQTKSFFGQHVHEFTPLTSSTQLATRCFDMCYASLLVSQFGLVRHENDHRLGFVESLDHVRINWQVGAYLYFEESTRRIQLAQETSLLTEQINRGSPLGIQLSGILLVVALAYLYTVVTRASSTPSRKYQQLIGKPLARSGTSCSRRRTTCAMQFVHDASE